MLVAGAGNAPAPKGYAYHYSFRYTFVLWSGLYHILFQD